MNEFKTDLKYSLDQRECEWFDNFYHRVFPGIKDIEVVEDLVRQRKGIDKVISFNSGYQVTIDEKKRRKDYGDILIEIWSNYEKGKRGWLYYSECDYIVYAIMPTQTVYLLPVLLLKRAWYKNGDRWTDTYGTREAINPGYTTVNVPVEIDQLLGAIAEEMQHKVAEKV